MQVAIIEDELGRMLQSKTFSRASRLRKFLEYIVQEELAGNGGQLKEYQIGVAVFERGAGFDPCIDTIVRVEAIKLRARLNAYFEDEGATEPVRISIPKGSYRPVFELRDKAPTPILENPEALYWQARALGKDPDELRRALRLLSLGVRRWPSKRRPPCPACGGSRWRYVRRYRFSDPERGPSLDAARGAACS